MKVKSAWHCTSCGHKQLRWAGQCPTCQEWNTLQEEVETKSSRKSAGAPQAMRPMPLKEIAPGKTSRIASGLTEFDRCIGGGLVAGSLTLIGGDPGIGKSTLSLQI